MNQSGVGLIEHTENVTRLIINPMLAHSFGLGPGSTIYGCYYPKPDNKSAAYARTSAIGDFMLTPIPYYLWDRSARLIIHMEHKEGTFKSITELLAEEGISIINAISTRSGYNHATYTLHVAFAGLGDTLEYNEDLEYYEETFEKVKKVRGMLEEKLDKNFAELDTHAGVEYLYATVNHSLAYFHNYIKTRKQSSGADTFHDWFELTLFYQDDFLYLSSDGLRKVLSAILDHQGKRDNLKYPYITFSELDTRALNIRMALIPEAESMRFMEIGLEYERTTEEAARGVIACITNNFTEKYNLWRSYNFTISNSITNEKGRIVFLVEDIRDYDKREAYVDKASGMIKYEIIYSLSKSNKNVKIVDSKLIQLASLTKDSMRAMAKKTIGLHKKTIFISFSHINMEYAKVIVDKLKKINVQPYKYDERIKFGDNIADNVKENLNNCSEMCLILTPESIDSQWVAAEYGAMWAMGKTVIPILIGLTKAQLPDIFSQKHCIIFKTPEEFKEDANGELDTYVAQAYSRMESNLILEYINTHGLI